VGGGGEVERKGKRKKKDAYAFHSHIKPLGP